MTRRLAGMMALWSLFFLSPTFAEGWESCQGSEIAHGAVDRFLEDLRQLDLELASLALTPEAEDATTAFAVAHFQLETMLARDPAVQRQALCEALERLPTLGRAPQELRQILTGAPIEQGDGEVGSIIDPLCLSTPAYLAAFGSFQILKTASTVAQTICDASECPVYAGVIVCAPVPPSCALACPIAGIAEGLALVAEAFLTGDDYCGAAASKAFLEAFSAETSMALGDVVSQMQAFEPLLDVPLSSRATALSIEALDGGTAQSFAGLALELDDSLSALATLENRREELEALETRLRIEELLAEPDGGPVGSLRRTADEGGELEVVREVVAQAIQRTLDAGEGIGEALFFFSRGDALLNDGSTLPAYNNFRWSYLEVAAETLEPKRAPSHDESSDGGAS